MKLAIKLYVKYIFLNVLNINLLISKSKLRDQTVNQL